MATLNKFTPSVAFHPGVTLSEKLKEMEMGIKEFAIRTSKPEKTIYAVINGESSLTPDMAVAFEIVTNIPAHFWLNKQRAYDEYKARIKREEQLAYATEWARSFPFAAMTKLGWIAAAKTIEEKAASLFSYFKISSVKAWEDYYLNQELKIAFRISLNNTKDPHAISAWLRQGELQADQIETPEYSEKRLQEAIPEMKNICAQHPEDFAQRLQNVCKEVGIKLVFTPCLPKAPISGSTRWINDTPCIQITGRQKRNDIFWFTFFHELGHILLHGKKDIFLEDAGYTDIQKQKEDEADNYASKILLSSAEEHEIIMNGDFSIKAIKRYAIKFNTHPAIIVGRLQHKNIISFSRYNELIERFDLFN